MRYVSIFHANLNYAYLTPDRYEFVIRSSYELILDVLHEYFPECKFVFEASGYTIDRIAEKAPDVLGKLRRAIDKGQCEFMGSPYAHPMLPNFPKEDGVWSIAFSNIAYERHLGMVPKSFWNPECGWRGYVPQQVVETGYRNLVGDFEAYSRSCGPDGKPLRPDIYEKERSDGKAFYSFDFHYDLPGSEKAIHFPFNKVAGVNDDALRVFLRTDRVAQHGVRFFMGMDGYTLDSYLDLIKRYSEQPAGEKEGALIIFADDAEYIGTNGWFRLKYQKLPDNVFEPTPQSKENLIRLLSACSKLGSFITFDEACSRVEPLPDRFTVDDDAAWHGAKASVWASTPMARLLRPWQDLVREKLRALQASNGDRNIIRQCWFHLTNSYNSDGQWPPTLPEEPHIVHPFNYGFCFKNLLMAEQLIGGVDRSRLPVDPVKTLNEILLPQQEIVLKKADAMIEKSDNGGTEKGRYVRLIIEMSQCVDSLKQSNARLLYPDEYKVRADVLGKARKMVGGIY